MLNGICTECDHKVCATCSGTPTNCIIPCDSGCSSCDPTGNCGPCAYGFFLNVAENKCY